MNRVLYLAALASIMIAAAGCAMMQRSSGAEAAAPVTVAPAVDSGTAAPRLSPLETVLLGVSPYMDRGEVARADSALAAMSARYDGSCIAAESNYLRALLRVTAPGPATRVGESVELLDRYLTSTCPSGTRVEEARFLRRVALEATRKSLSADSASAEEVRKLKEQLDQTKKDLDRLKMRIIPPR
jgi:hypothetical protein